LALFLPVSSFAQSVTTDGGTISVAQSAALFGGRGYSPYASRSNPTHVYWGDQHLHTCGPRTPVVLARGWARRMRCALPVVTR